jgi:hypothetical protein
VANPGSIVMTIHLETKSVKIESTRAGFKDFNDVVIEDNWVTWGSYLSDLELLQGRTGKRTLLSGSIDRRTLAASIALDTGLNEFSCFIIPNRQF